LKFVHPVTRLFFGLQSGSTTQKNRLELLFPMVWSKKLFQKNCVQGGPKTKPLHFACPPCILEAKMLPQTYNAGLRSS